MAGRIAGYVLVLLLTGYLFFMYNDTVLSGILIFIVLYLPLSLGYLLAIQRKMEVHASRVPAMGEQGKQIRAGITVKNRGRFSGARYCISVVVRNTRTGRKETCRFRGSVGAGCEETVWCGFSSKYCGNMEITVKSVCIYDFLGIFCIRKKLKEKATVKIMPSFEIMPLEITKKTRDFQADADEYSGEKKGDDPAEIYQVREYRLHDSMRDVHWKLSAKEDELMVKERGFPLGCVVLVWIDLAEKDSSPEGFSRALETAASLSVTLAEEKCIHLAAWYEEKEMRVVSRRVRDEESAYEMIWRLMEAKPYRDAEKKQICFEEAFKGHNFSSVVTIDGKGVLRKDGEIPELLRL
ncbi:hypothetical protein B5F07_00895 [Lachnoclostridium sp. An169]|uniref:DUF58 domain-containing protein n=1 Tax=Lachnoclostridium sp. An169 TaxID=1965569 RepID=UPI000B3923BE|nr:DUF58 domain-containing protein [Lachnoclostridium sp. An169]OUP86579.1 hypothetical protein B5F07_00895 [Lachnoclostridium sp. An169]